MKKNNLFIAFIALVLMITIYSCSSNDSASELSDNLQTEQLLTKTKRMKVGGEDGDKFILKNDCWLSSRSYTDNRSGYVTWTLLNSFTHQPYCTTETSWTISVPMREDTYYHFNDKIYSIKYISSGSGISGLQGINASFVDTDMNTSPVSIGYDNYVRTSDKQTRIKCVVTGNADFPCDPSPNQPSGVIVAPGDFYLAK